MRLLEPILSPFTGVSGQPLFAQYPQSVELPVLPNTICQQEYHTSDPDNYVLDVRTFCAGGEDGRGTCKVLNQ